MFCIKKKTQTTASISLVAVQHAMHTLGTFNENLSTSFYFLQASRFLKWKPKGSHSLPPPKCRSQQHHPARGATTAWFSLLVIPSLPATALQSFWGLCKMQLGRAERAQQRNTATGKFCHIISWLPSRGLTGINFTVWWDLLAFSLLLLPSCSCLLFISFFTG